MKKDKCLFCYLLVLTLLLSAFDFGPGEVQNVAAEAESTLLVENQHDTNFYMGVSFGKERYYNDYGEDDWWIHKLPQDSEIYLYRSEEDWENRKIDVEELSEFYDSFVIDFILQSDNDIDNIEITAELRDNSLEEPVVFAKQVDNLQKGRNEISIPLVDLNNAKVDDVVLVVSSKTDEYSFEIKIAESRFTVTGEEYLPVVFEGVNDLWYSPWEELYSRGFVFFKDEYSKYNLSELFGTYRGIEVSFYANGIGTEDVWIKAGIDTVSSERQSQKDFPRLYTSYSEIGEPVKIHDGVNCIKFDFNTEMNLEFKFFDDIDVTVYHGASDIEVYISEDEESYNEYMEAYEELGDEWAFGYVPDPIVGTYDWPDTKYDDNGNVLIAESNFPDEAFRSYIADEFDTDKDNVLSAEEITNATSIVIGEEVEDVMGIQIFTELTYLDISAFDIPDFNILNNNRKLEKIGYCGCKGYYKNLRCFPELKAIKGSGILYGPDELESIAGRFVDGDHTFIIADYTFNYSGWDREQFEADNARLRLDLSDYHLSDDLKIESVIWGIVNDNGKGWFLSMGNDILEAGIKNTEEPQLVHIYSQICVEGKYSKEDIMSKIDSNGKVQICRYNMENPVVMEFDLNEADLRVETQVCQYYQVDYSQFVGKDNIQYCTCIFNQITEQDEPLIDGIATLIPCGVDWWGSEDNGPAFSKNLRVQLLYDNGFSGVTYDGSYETLEDWIMYDFRHFTSVEEINVLPEELSQSFESVEAMESEIVDGYKEFSCDVAVTYDADMWNFAIGTGWEKTSEDEFPAEGVEVFVPFPEGTDENSEFKVAHIFTKDCNGFKKGDVEYPEVTVVDSGIKFTVMGFSPIIVAGGEITENSSESSSETEPDPVVDPEPITDSDPVEKPQPIIIISPVIIENTPEEGNASVDVEEAQVTDTTSEETAKNEGAEKSEAENGKTVTATEKLQQETENVFTGNKVTVTEQNPDDAIAAILKKSTYYDENGKKIANSFIEASDGTQKYVGAKGKPVKKTIVVSIDAQTGESKMFYAGKNGNIMKSKVISLPDGSRIFATEDGSLAINEIVKAPNGYRYYADENGVIVRNSVIKLEDGTRYYANKYGVIKKNALVTDPSGHKHYATADGTLAKSCWITVGDVKYWCNKAGRITKQKTVK